MKKKPENNLQIVKKQMQASAPYLVTHLKPNNY